MYAIDMELPTDLGELDATDVSDVDAGRAELRTTGGFGRVHFFGRRLRGARTGGLKAQVTPATSSAS
jgi:hypothetical protein